MEENLENDQVSTDSSATTPAPTKGAKVLAKDQVPQKQSETTEEPVASNLYDLPDGRKLAGDQLKEEYLKLNSEFTRRSQKLADYERQQAETEARNKKTAEEAVSQNRLLENVDPSVRDAIVQIVSPVIQEALSAREKVEAQKRNQEAFDTRLAELEKKYPGKFDRVEILRKMQDPSNEIYDPEVLYQRLHWDEYLDAQIKAAMKGKSSGVQTENTSTEAPRKPGESKSPSTWAEASKNAVSRL